ncbi:O-antigen ligase family protein [uncultured Polaribacter sp.]|uniref:O-antigen ligase family protein n=1 Tax=uncultured Polaribacter sp. TaxID=174711 RepID=UPI00262CDF47|nr:O-antigen ligase family protein [uncultured Polaribacter sp.]
MLWVYGYYSYNKQNEFQKIDWYKSEIITPINYISKASNFNIKINPNAIKPSLRKVVMLSNSQAESYAVRELIIKVKNNIKKDVWVLLRNVNSGDCKVWFNVSTGKIGKIEGETTEVNSEKVFNNFYKFTFLNKIKKNNNREWFYLSFVSSNGSYSWSKQYQQDVIVELQNPSFYLDSGQNLLIDESFFEHKLTDFSYLKNYSHSTYFGLIFIFSLIIFIFNSFSNKYLKISAILLNGFFIITLASKAIIISLFLIIPIYYLYHYFNYKYLFIFILVGLFLSFNSHVKERFSDMYTTIINIKKNENLGDLKTLSTNNRIHIYKNYISLIKENYLIGYGYKKGAKIVESKYNYTFNTHNQYLQSIFYGGFFGFLSLILFSFSPFFLKVKKVGLDILIIIILFNFLFESMLVRQWGLVFVCFCYAIYFQFLKPDLKWFQ